MCQNGPAHANFLLSLALGSLLIAQVAVGRPLDEPFVYDFYGTDVTKWQNGDGSPTLAPIASGAEILAAHLQDTQEELLIAFYGVYHQRWFIDMMSSLKRRTQISAVVDQMRGQTGEWLPENFNYPDTPDLAQALGEANMHSKFLVSDRSSVWLGSAKGLRCSSYTKR